MSRRVIHSDFVCIPRKDLLKRLRQIYSWPMAFQRDEQLMIYINELEKNTLTEDKLDREKLLRILEEQ